MRATYEDLLRTARRIAVSAQRGVYVDQAEVLADWDAVLAATRNHLCRLGVCLKAGAGGPAAVERSENCLGRLAQAIGAGADLLAVQDSLSAVVLSDREDRVAAAAEVAAVALMGARVVERSVRVRARGPSRLRRVMRELTEIARADVRGAGLGGIGVLAAGPAPVGGALSMVGARAARWERAHAEVSHEVVLTRDLRSTTAQLRTIGGQGWYVASLLLSARSSGLDLEQRVELESLRQALGSLDGAAVRVDADLRRRLSDLGRRSDSPDEVAFLDLKGVVDRVLGDGQWRSAELMDAADELLWAAVQVARHLERTVHRMIWSGRLFVPRSDAARVELTYLRRPTGGARLLQPYWVRTDRMTCFSDVIDDLARFVDHLETASGVARRLAGTAAVSRSAIEPMKRMPARFRDLDLSGIDDQGWEFAEPGR
ncbi:hypothetical protein [Kribbella solani]|uniref:Uncharacterized protein n=1 Tax=Kribbella solani TaxID=236067 RepID=A0A841DU75_9ACTN|nr:hypothetical protein [Kribbella solani]MBB5979837.1 hypothetical protein [Kribbella solani]